MVTASFDDIATGEIANPYSGVSWLSLYVQNPAEANPGNLKTGFHRGITSGDQIAYMHDIGAFAAYNGHGTFTFRSVNLTAGNDKSLVLDIYGYNNNVVIYHDMITLNDHKPIHFAANYVGVDYVYFHTGAETPDPKQPGSGAYVVFDDVKLKSFDPDAAGTPPRHEPAFAGVGAHDHLWAPHPMLDHPSHAVV